MVPMPGMSFDGKQSVLTDAQKSAWAEARKAAVETILVSTSLAASGHPGGSLSCIDLLFGIYGISNIHPGNLHAEDRDVVIVSNGHISPGVYATLATHGFVSTSDVITGFRKAGSMFAGHIETKVPGVEWNTGNLGQGLSAGAGAALARKLRGNDGWSWVLMGDGEQQKGQIAEARRFAVKFGLDNLVCVVDRNFLQIGGDTREVMDQNVEADFAAAGWNVCTIDGHDPAEIFETFARIRRGEVPDASRPTCVVAKTVMSKGVPFMENKAHYHGSPLSEADLRKALAECGIPDRVDHWKAARAAAPIQSGIHEDWPTFGGIDVGPAVTRTAATDCRSAYGDVLEDLARRNNGGAAPKVLGVSSDLEGSVKMSGFRKISPKAFFEGGIQEHNNAVVAGRLAREGFLTFFSTFGVFGVCESYNQQRLNDINMAGLKVVCTHLGLDVGEDGPTHQNIDYVGLMLGTFGFEVYLPLDPNQTDRVIRHAATTRCNTFVGMGRSKMPLVTKPDGSPFYDDAYTFTPGKMDVIREGTDVTLVTMGAASTYALAGAKLAAERGVSVQVLGCASIRPFDVEGVRRAATTGAILTVEDHSVQTGLGALVAQTVADLGLVARLKRLGATRYGTSGPSPEVFREQGMSAENIASVLVELARR